MKRQAVRIMAAAALLLFAVDILASRLANRHVVNADYNFKMHLSNADLGEKRGKRSDRMIHSVFGIYLFETCFFRATEAGNEEWMYNFRYASPYPVLLGGRNLESFRFKECGSGQSLKRIYHDGRIEELE